MELDDKQLQDELNSLALYFSNRELHPTTVAAMCAASCGEIIGRNRAAGTLDDETAEAMLQSAYRNMREIAFCDRAESD